MGKVHGSLARAGKVRGQTPKVAKQETKKNPTGRAKKRLQVRTWTVCFHHFSLCTDCCAPKPQWLYHVYCNKCRYLRVVFPSVVFLPFSTRSLVMKKWTVKTWTSLACVPWQNYNMVICLRGTWLLVGLSWPYWCCAFWICIFCWFGP